MHQVLLQRGCHSFIRYCASESVFAGFRRIAKLATGIAIAVAFTGIALPTSSAQAQTARFSVTGQFTPGQTTFAENEEASFILRLDGFRTDQDIATAEVELVVQQITTGFSAPQGNTFEGTFFDIAVEGDNSRAVTLSVGGGANNRMKAIVAFDPDDSTAGVGQPAVITWTIRPKDIASTQTFRIRRTNNGRVVLKNSAGVAVSRLAPTFVENFTITPVIAEDAVFVTRTYQNGDTIPNIKTETPTNTSEAGVDWTSGFGINLLAGKTARYSDGTAYECDSASSGNCLIRIPGGQIANGGPVNATFPEESAPPPAPPPPVTETQDPRLIYTYENLAVIPDHLFKSEEPTNASSAGITWTDGESLAITHNSTATYSDGTTYECLSSGGCVITFASRQINSGGQVRISQPFDTAEQQFIPGATAGIRYAPAGIPGPDRPDSPTETVPENVRARSISESQGTGTAGVQTYQVDPFGFPDNVTATCVYGLGGDALYLGEDTGDVNTSAGDYVLLADAFGTRILLNDDRFSLPEERDADVNHLFTDACGPGVITPTRIKITADDVDEPNEVISIVLKRVTLFIGGQELGSARVSEPDTLAITITDDDDPTIPQVTAVNATRATATEVAGATRTAEITVTFAAAVGPGDLVIDYGILGGDGLTVADSGDGFTAADITSIAITPGDADDVNSNSAGSNLTEIPSCVGIEDLRCGTLSITDTVSPFETTITITANDDAIPEASEGFTFFLRGRRAGPPPGNDASGNPLPDERESNVLFPNFGALADRSARISITDDDSTTVALVDADTDGDFIYGAAVVLERSAANTSTSLNNTFTLNAATNATLGYLLTGPGAGDIAVTAGSGDAANTTAVTPNDDPRGGTFTVTGTTGTTGSLQLTAAADAVLEGTESFTLTLYAGNPDDTRLLLANGAKNYTITDATDVTARLTWPGTTTRTGGEQRPSRGDASSPIGESVFPGGVLEGASPHVLLDLHVTGDDTTPVTVGRDLFFPISCRRMTGTSTFSTPNCGPLGLDIRIESINDDKGTSARSDDTIAHGFFIRAGRSQEATGINIVPDANAEPDETFVFNTGAPIEFRGQATPVGIGDRVTPFATDASLTVHDRPVDAGDITWMPEDPAQADFGAGLTKIADLVITLPGGFTADHSAVTVDYTYNGSDALGSISFRDPDNTSTIYATREVILRNEDDDVIGTRERITVVRTSFSKADPGSDPTATVGLYFSPAASGSGERPTVDIKKVSHADLLTVSFDRDLCNDGLPGEAPGSDLCANQQFGVGIPMTEFPSAGRVLAASEAGPSEAGPVVGSVPFRIFTSSTPEENFFPDSVDATIGFTLGGTARRGLSPNSRDYVLSVLRSDNPDGTGNPADITPAFTSANAGTVPLADGNRAQYVIFRVTPNADGINEGTETVEIRVSDVTFSDSGSTTDIAVNRGQTVRIANEQVATMEFTSSYGNFRLDTVEGATNRRGRNLAGGDNSRTNNIASVRLTVRDIPTAAFYADISYQVDPASTATDRSQAGGGATEDYTIARPSFVTGSSPDGTTGLGTSNTVTIDREHGAGQEIGDNNRLSNLDYWLNIIDDSIVEPPETVIMNLTATFFPCSGAVTGTQFRPVCADGRGSQQVGPTIPFSFTFLINDNEAASAIRNQRLSPSGVVNEGGGVQAVFAGNERAQIDNNETFFYNITDASGGVITENNLGVTAADFRVTTNTNVGACGTPTAEQMAAGIICRGVYTATGSASIQINLEIVDDELGENEEAFYVNLEPATLPRGNTGNFPGNPVNVEIAEGTRLLVTIPDSDGGGPPPVLGPTAALATTGEREIEDDIGETTLTLQITEIPSDPVIATARATLAFGNTPGFTGVTSNVVSGPNYNVSVAIAGGSLADDATTQVGDNIIVEFPFTGDDAPVLTYTIEANNVDDENLPYAFNVNIESVVFLDGAGTPNVVTLDPVIAEVGEPQNLSIVAPAAPPGVSIVATDPDATEAITPATDPGSYTFTLVTSSGEPTTSPTVVEFTVAPDDGNRQGTAEAGNCVAANNAFDEDGNCRAYSAAPNDTIDYYLATRAGSVGSFDYTAVILRGTDPITSSVTIPTGETEVELFVLPVRDDVRTGNARDANNETVTITLNDPADRRYAVNTNNREAVVNIVDPGRATLSRRTGADVLGLGGVNTYVINLDNVGVSDMPSPRAGEAGTANRHISDRPGTNGFSIDAVIDLNLPNNTITTPLPTDFANPIIGDNYNILLEVPAGANYTVSVFNEGLRVIVPQARLRQFSDATDGGNFEGNEEFVFDVISKAVTTETVVITMDAYTIATTTNAATATRLTAPVEAISGNSFSVVAAPVVTFTSTLADDQVIAGTQGVVANNPATPETAADPNALQINITNPFATELSSARVEHTLRIAPTAGTATGAFNGEITIIPDPGSQSIMAVDGVDTLQGAVVTFTTPDDDANAREFNVRYTTFPTLAANGQANDDATLNISLGATVFGGDDKRYTISLVNTRIEDSAGDVLANGPGAPEQPLDVVVPASDLPTATLTVTGPLEIEDGGDATLGGLDTTTFEVSLENITPAAADTAMIVAVAFDGTAASNAFNRGADTNSNYLGVSTVNEVLYLMLDDDAFTDNEETIPVEFYLVPANAAVDETIIPRIVSANFYTESDDSGSNLLRAQDLALAITASSLPAANAATSVATANIINGPAADRTFTVVAEGAAPAVSLLPALVNQGIASGNLSFADITVSLANLPATIGTDTVGSVRLTLKAESTSFATTVSDGGKAILFGATFRMTLPTEIEGLVFIPNSPAVRDNPVQVSVPAGTTEFAIRVRVPGTGRGSDTIRITEVAYYDDASPPAEISDAPPPHLAPVGTGVAGVDDAVVASLSADGPTTIGTGGGVLGMTEFSLTLTNLDANDGATIPLTLSDNGTPEGDGATTASGTNYDVEILSTTGDGDPDAAIFALGVPPSVSLTAAADGTVTVNFRITSTSTANTPAALPHDFTVSIGEISVEDDDALPNPREEVVQTASLAYSIIAAGDVRSVRFVPLAPSTDLTVDEGGDTGTATLRLANIPSEIPPGIGGVLVDHIDITLRATGLTFNRAPADGQSITLGNAAATLTIDSADHAFVNTDNPETVILQVNGAEASNITFTGGFVDRDMEFTLTPTNLAYYSTAPDAVTPATLPGPNGADEVSFLPATFSVNVMPISASIATDQNKIVVDDVGGGEVVISMANLPVSSETTSVQVDVTFGTGANFNFDPDTEASPRLGITGVSNADGEDYTLAYSTNVLSITVPRSRLLASTGDNPEAQGEEEITVNFTALTADAAYNVVVSGSLMDGSDITFAPGTLAFTTVAATATLKAFLLGGAPLGVDNRAAEEDPATAIGQWILRLNNVAVPTEDVVINYTIPALEMVRTAADDILDATPVTDYTLTADDTASGTRGGGPGTVTISEPEGNPTEGYTGTLTIGPGAYVDTDGDGITDVRIDIFVTPVDDNIVEGMEDARLMISEVPGAAYTPEATDQKVRITDNDTPVVFLTLNGLLLNAGEFNTSNILEEGLIYPVQLFVKNDRVSSINGGIGYSDTSLADDDENLIFTKDVSFTVTLSPPHAPTDEDERANVMDSTTDADVRFSDGTALLDPTNTVTVTIPAGATSSELVYIDLADEDDPDDANEKFSMTYAEVADPLRAAILLNPTDGETGNITINREATASTNLCAGRTPAVATAIRDLIRTGTGTAYTGTNDATVVCSGITSTQLGGIAELDLSGVTPDLTSLQPGDFAGLTGLTTLNLSDNNLRALPAGVFDALAGTYNAQTEVTVGGVGTIDLSGNSLTAAGLPDDVFDDLVALETLDLGDNDTLTSLPVGLLDSGTANSGALFDLMSLTLPSAVQGRVNFATNAVTLTRGSTATVTVEIVDAENGNPLSMPISLFIQVRTVGGVSVNNTPPIGDGNNYNVSPGFIIIPAGESSVDVTFTASATAAVSDRNIAFDFSSASITNMVVPNVGTTSNFLSYPSSNVHGVAAIERVRNALFRAGTTNTIVTTVVAPVALDPTTATAAELNNDAATVQLNLGRTAADVGTADVTFELSGGDGLGTDYNLAITDPDGNAVNNTSGTALALAVGATTGTFRLPADVSAATFTLTPIADGFPSTAEGNEDITIAVIVVDYSDDGAAAQTIPGVSAVITIADNPTAPTVAVTPSTPVGGDTELTEGSADGRGTFTIALSDAPEGTATVSYTLAVDDETNPAVPFNAITGVDTTGLGGEVPVNPEDTTTPDASPRVFTMNVASGASAATGSLAFTAAIDADRVGESVVFTVTGVTFADDGDGTDIADPTNDTATITIVDATPDSSICTRTQQVYEAILDELNLAANQCMMVENGSAALMTLNPSGGLTVDGLSGLKAGDFADLDALTTLSLTNGTFTTLPAGVFDEPDALTSLTIDAALTGLTDGVFDTLVALRTLDLSGNAIAGVADATIFTPLAALTTLNLGGNTTLSLANGALDGVLDTLTSLTWPTQLQRTASFVEDGVTVGRNGTANINVTLGGTNTLPVAVTIPITATLSTISVADAVIPAGTTSVAVTITAEDAVADVGGTIMLGNPMITGSLGNVRTELIANNADTATLTVVSGPTVTLAQGPTSSFPRYGGGSATFTLSFASIPTSAGGTPTTVTDVRTRLTFTGTAANRTVTRAPAVGTLTASGGDFDFDISPADAGTNSLITFTIASTGSGAEDFTVTLTSAVLRDNGSSTITGAGATVATAGGPLNFTIVAPPDSVDVMLVGSTPIAEAGGSVGITVSLNRAVLADTDGDDTTNPTVSLPFTIGGSANTEDYAITFPSGDDCTACVGRVVATDGSGTLVFAATEQTLTIRITATSDSRDDDGEDIIFTLTGPAWNGVTVGAEDTVTITISDDDVPPNSASAAIPEAQRTIDEDGGVSSITVSLSPGAVLVGGTIVNVDFTIAGTATAADYMITFPSGNDCASCMGSGGTLVFGEGEQMHTITITALPDEEEEDPDETILFNLTAGTANGVTVSAANAAVHTITIEESTVDMEEVMMQVETVATVVATEHVSALTGLIRQRFSATSSFASPPRVPTGAVPAPSTDTNLSLPDNPENMNDMINSMGLESSAQGDSNDRYAVWIRGQRSAFEGTPEVQGLTVNYDGTSTGVGVGAEYISSGYLMGLAMNFVTTEVDLSTEGGEGSESITKYEESIVIAAPYISLKVSEGTSMWASAGYGSGTADAKLSGETKSADVSLSFLNAGADFTLIGRGFEVVTGLSGLLVRKVVDAFTFADTTIPETTIDTTQAVGEITVYRPIHIAGQTLRPYVGVSTIHDFGDIVADDDHGLGIRSGVAFSLGRISTDIEVSSELLRENRRQWTVSGGLRFASRPRGLGLSLALEGTQETLMDAEDATDDAADRTWGVGLEGGYGMSMDLLHPDGVLTPFASVDQTGNGRDMSGGVRFSVGNGLSLDLETTRQMHDDSEDTSEHKAGLRGKWSF